MDDQDLQVLLETNDLEQKPQNVDSSGIHKLHLCICRLAMRRSGFVRGVGFYIRLLETSNRVSILMDFLREF